MKKAIVSVNVGDYDSVKEPQYIDADFDYLYFSDKDVPEGSIWRYIPLGTLVDGKSNSHLISRQVKTNLCRLQYDLIVYMDASMQQIGSISKLIDEKHKDYLTICKHPARDCIYQEADECIRLGFSDEWKTKFQMMEYIKEGYPSHNGLVMGGFFIVTNCLSARNFFVEWKRAILNYDCRDQLCFNYAMWKTNQTYNEISDLDVFGKVVKTYPHIRKR